MADLGMETSVALIDELRDRVKKKHITDGNQVKKELQAVIADALCELDSEMKLETRPSVILVIGVNGVGKTTSIGKMASFYKSQGKNVLLAAADTFRAAAKMCIRDRCNDDRARSAVDVRGGLKKVEPRSQR